METARGIPPRIFIPFECAYEDHSNGFIILIPAGFLGGRIRTPIPRSFPRIQSRSSLADSLEYFRRQRELAAPATTHLRTLLFRRRILRSSSNKSSKFNFQPMILSRKKKKRNGGIVLRGHGYVIICRYIIGRGVNRRRGREKAVLRHYWPLEWVCEIPTSEPSLSPIESERGQTDSMTAIPMGWLESVEVRADGRSWNVVPAHLSYRGGRFIIPNVP